MNITLISVSGRLACDGSRLISSILKRAGHKVKNIYLARREPDYEMSELEPLTEILQDTDLVMIAVYSNYYGRAVKLTNLVHQRFPKIEGGMGRAALYRHPGIEPQICRYSLFLRG